VIYFQNLVNNFYNNNSLEVIENYQHNELRREDTNKEIELDIYLPQESLAFEYQGEQHYYDIYAMGNRWNQRQKDEEKRILCLEKGITLIEIPYWWDKEKLSLISSIHKQRPDLIYTPINEQPIPIQPKEGFPNGNIIFLFLLNFLFHYI
jgi:hypothetical protein